MQISNKKKKYVWINQCKKVAKGCNSSLRFDLNGHQSKSIPWRFDTYLPMYIIIYANGNYILS